MDRILAGPTLYDAQRFSSVNLSPETKEMLASNATGAAALRRNRALLEEAFPGADLRQDVLAFLKVADEHGWISVEP